VQETFNVAKPFLLSVDDDSDVLRAIERDLRSQYGAEYQVIGSDCRGCARSPEPELKVRNDRVALPLADQRMPRIDGVEFLQQGMGDTLSRSRHATGPANALLVYVAFR
jgi:thioredoxin reductase (NADPH)